MPRVARTVIADWPHHVTQRGNNHQDVFFTDNDRRTYLTLLHERCAAADVRVLGYCLMRNHVHLVLVPPDEAALAAAVGRVHWLYTQYVNRLHGRSGHLWQNRFFSCPMDEPHAWAAIRYVERNPVRARIVRLPWRYAWSSAAAHVGEPPAAPDAGPTKLLDLASWQREWTPPRWRAALQEADDTAAADGLRRNTMRGRPLASDSLLSKLETRLGRRLRPLPIGRPRKTAGSKTSRGTARK